MNTANLSELLQGQVFHALIVLAVSIYALNAILIAVEAGYDLWGRFVLGCLQGLGGGTIRDFLIGGNRMPLFYTRDPAFLIAIFSVTAVVSILAATKADFHQSAAFQTVAGFSYVNESMETAAANARSEVTTTMMKLEIWRNTARQCRCAKTGVEHFVSG